MGTIQRRSIARPLVDSPDALGVAYWRAVRAASLGLVRVESAAGGVELRLVGGPLLLRLGPAATGTAGGTLTYRRLVEGGLLAGEPGGTLTLTQAPREVAVDVTDFVPRWGLGLYRLVQRPFHAWVSRRFFAALARSR